MKKYNIIQPWLLAFFSKDLYRDVAKNWHGIGALYLLLLLIVTWIPLMYLFFVSLSEFVDTSSPQWVEQIPAVTINQGVVSIDKPSPYYIKDPKSGNPVIIIDTSGHYTTLTGTTAGILVMKDKIIMKKNEQETRIYELNKTDNYSFNKDTATKFLTQLKKWAPLFIYPLLVLTTFIYRLLQALIYAWIGLLFAHFMKVSLHYKELLRLTMIAITPTIIVGTILTFLQITFPYQGLFYFLLAMLYLVFAIHANKEEPVANV